MSSSAAVEAAVMGDFDLDLDRFLMRQLGARGVMDVVGAFNAA